MVTYSALSDQELTSLLRAGDGIAYTEIYQRYKRLLYLFAFKRLGDREEVKDIVHEIFTALWYNKEQLNLSYSLNTYLHSSVRNKIVDVIARKQVSARYVETFNAYRASGQSTTDHLIRQKELAALIEKEIEALPVKMRQVFELSRNSNYSRKQIAEELGLSEETVKSHMHHAMKILKVKLGPLLVLALFIQP
ncbi:RNA polymerase sigma-70 factor (family 1) [Pedobacter africanus]|uniref:RNA polymerase sigma-70 factor (ECF subfamily) n=1 Tax=Pedobacter africanus TaxID=151894 RepID=A0ACC6L4W8_9SPHI|nr:RNA polymerase sigma-70 factor [Pedobacter africanus]MDR6786452.1 RNA polymerase sigma-70 factor (ECF subfamily) [Pedobacter africanus]